ncbi:hypothetical protein Tco_1140335 [Tanacetum coccineum]
MTTPITTSITDSQMHDNIMAAGSRDRPPMLATGRYAQWQSCFLRYIDTRPNGDALRKCILEGPYTPSTVIIPVVPAIDDSLKVPERIAFETILNMSRENKEHYQSEKEAIHFLLIGIGDEIYSTVDACKRTHDIFTYHDGETMESYYSRFYKMINEMIRNNLTIAMINKNVDTSPRYKNDNHTGQFRNQRTVTVAGARETVGNQVQYDAKYNVFANERHHSEQLESISNICVVEKVDSNVILDSSDMCDNDGQTDQNVVECNDERVVLANLIANIKLDVDENKMIQKQLKKANTSLAHELKECKSILAETSRTLVESNSIRDSCLIALQNKQTELERYKTLNERTVDYDKLEHKLNETLGLLAQKEIDIKEGLKLKAYEISIVKEKHDELVKHSLLTKSHYEGLVKEKTKVITDLKLKEEKDIDKMISMEKQLKFLNKIVYKRNQSIQTIHMLAPKGPTFNGRPTFANPMYLKKAQSEKPCLYEIPYDQSHPANRLVPDREETLTLEKESRSKLNKDLVRP